MLKLFSSLSLSLSQCSKFGSALHGWVRMQTFFKYWVCFGSAFTSKVHFLSYKQCYRNIFCTHEVYAAPICVPVCKWYINCNNRQLANSSTTLDKASFSSTWLQPLAIMTSRIVFMKHIQGNDKFSLTIIIMIIIPYEPLPLRLVIR